MNVYLNVFLFVCISRLIDGDSDGARASSLESSDAAAAASK